jgi:hypothetical protein
MAVEPYLAVCGAPGGLPGPLGGRHPLGQLAIVVAQTPIHPGACPGLGGLSPLEPQPPSPPG